MPLVTFAFENYGISVALTVKKDIWEAYVIHYSVQIAIHFSLANPQLFHL